MTIEPRNARLEAQRLLESGGGAARVLEPSPPAADSRTTIDTSDDPYLADDPVDRARVEGGPVVLPVGLVDPTRDPATAIDWDTWLADRSADGREGLDRWAGERWLGGDRRLPVTPPPETLVPTRTALHRLAAYVIAPVRHRSNGKFGLRFALGGFGTPFFGDDRQIRVRDGALIDQRAGSVRQVPMTTLRAAAEFLDADIDPDTAAEHDSPPLGDIDEVLSIDPGAADFLGHWFGMAFAALEAVRADDASIDPSRPQLWPGHFDPAIEVGTEDTRASYGASPGDAGSDEPYLYVSLWWPDRLGLEAGHHNDDLFWNASGFTGRVLPLSEFPPDADPAVVAADFWRETRDRVHS